MNFFSALVLIRLEDISRVKVVLEDITNLLPSLHLRGDKVELGDELFAKAKLHLALLESDPGQAEPALECITEVLECFQNRQSRWVMPEQVHFLHSRALRANGLEAQADQALETAYQRLMMVAGNIDDQDLRRSFLENVRDNQAIQAAYRERLG
jgi:hypothetical protein